jgi:hypothetical protein
MVGTALMVGVLVGNGVGETDGPTVVGETDGKLVGFFVGEAEGAFVGFFDGETEGGLVVGAKEMVGAIEGGLVEGIEEGTSVGALDGFLLVAVEGARLALLVGEAETEGNAEGEMLGGSVPGAMVGVSVIRSLPAAAKSVLATRRTPVSSMDLIVNLKLLPGRLMVVILRGYLRST